MKSGLFSLALLFTLAACQVETPNGDIPLEYVESAKAYTGKYKGVIEKTAGELELKIDEYNRPSLTFKAEDGKTEILGKECNSEISELTAVFPKKKKNKVWLESISFGFEPGKCRHIEGRRVILEFKFKNSLPIGLKAYILKNSYQTEHCTPSSSDSGIDNCSTTTHYEYIKGSFLKQ